MDYYALLFTCVVLSVLSIIDGINMAVKTYNDSNEKNVFKHIYNTVIGNLWYLYSLLFPSMLLVLSTWMLLKLFLVGHI
jgi:hypothetical protein